MQILCIYVCQFNKLTAMCMYIYMYKHMYTHIYMHMYMYILYMHLIQKACGMI